jgi:hypothetical protein
MSVEAFQHDGAEISAAFLVDGGAKVSVRFIVDGSLDPSLEAHASPSIRS